MEKTAREGWVDAIRVLAIFMVVASHCGDNVPQAARLSAEYRTYGTVFNSLLRACVPLFVMLTGHLLLKSGKPCGPDVCWRRRIPRVAVPFLIWGAAHSLFPWIAGLCGGGLGRVRLFFAWADGDPSQTLGAGLLRCLGLLRNFNTYTSHLWYIYVVIGLYLYLPVFGAWVARATDREKRAALALWGASLFLPYIRAFLPAGPYPGQAYAWGACAWNEFHMLYSFAGFNGYLLLGHLLGRGRPLSPGRALAFALPAFAAGFAVTLTGFRAMLALPGATEAQQELFFTYCSPNVALMAAAVWVLMRRVPAGGRLLAHLADCSFCIYLTHYLFLGPVYRACRAAGLPEIPHLILSSALTLLAAWGLAALLRLLPGAYWLTGAKRTAPRAPRAAPRGGHGKGPDTETNPETNPEHSKGTKGPNDG